ncbi:ribonuclease H-like domain-containing protein [Tanacetum coccineum]
MGHFAKECRAPRSKDNRNWNQGSSSKAVRIEDASEKAMCAIDGAGFDWSDMAEDEIQANMALIKHYDDLLVKIDDTAFKASTYKRGLSILEGKIIKYKESEVLFSEEIALLKRSVGHKEYLMGLLKTELEKVKEEKEGFEFKIAKFEKSSKDLDQLLASQITDKSKKGFGYNVVPSPHPLILNRPTPLDLSYSGLQEFKQPEVNEYGLRDSNVMPITGCDKESNNSKKNTDDFLKQQQKTDSSLVKEEEPKKARENNDAPIIEDWVSDDEEEVEPIPKVEKKTAIPTATKKESVKTKKPIRRSVSCPNAHKHMLPRAVLMKDWPQNYLINARPFNNRPSYTAHPKSTVLCARPRTHFQNQAQSTVQRPFFKKTVLTKSSKNQTVNTGRQTVNTGRQNVNTVRARGFNDVKPSACWVWRPIKPNGASLLNDKGLVDSGCSRHMSRNIAHLSDFKDFDGGYVTFGGGANGGRYGQMSPQKCVTKETIVLFFTDSECLVLSPNFKLPDENQILLKIPRQDNMYSIDMKNIVPKDGLTCLVAKATSEESMLCIKRKKKGLVMSILKNIIYLVKENRSRTPQQNGVAERKNRTLIEAARTMLADSKLPITFWSEAVSTACYVQNKVLIVKPHNKTLNAHSSKVSSVLGKFDEKSDEGFFVGYSLSSKAFRVYNIRTRKVQENLHVGFLENKPMIEGNGPKWLFDLDSLTQSMNYVPVVAGTFSNDFADPVADAQLKAQIWDSYEIAIPSELWNCYQTKYLMGPIPTSEDTQMEDQEIELGNLSPYYAVSSTPQTRIHKDHPIDHVIGSAVFVQTRKDDTTYYLRTRISGHRSLLVPKCLTETRKYEGGYAIRNKARLVAQDIPKEDLPRRSFVDEIEKLKKDNDYAETTLDRKSTTGRFVSSSEIFEFLASKETNYSCCHIYNEAEYDVLVYSSDHRFPKSKSHLLCTHQEARVKINATIDGHSLSITEGSFRRHLKLRSRSLGGMELEEDKNIYSASAYTKLILRVKKLEARVKIGKARRQSRVILSDDEDLKDDSYKQGRKLSDAKDQEKASTASEEVPIVSTAEVNLSTAGGTVTYSRRSAEKRSRQDKGKAIMIESEPKKKSKKEL